MLDNDITKLIIEKLNNIIKSTLPAYYKDIKQSPLFRATINSWICPIPFNQYIELIVDEYNMGGFDIGDLVLTYMPNDFYEIKLTLIAKLADPLYFDKFSDILKDCLNNNS